MSKRLTLKDFLLYYLGLNTGDEERQIFHSQESNEMLDKEWNNITHQGQIQSFRKNLVLNNILRQIEKNSPTKVLIKRNVAMWSKYAVVLVAGILTGALLTFMVGILPTWLETRQMVVVSNPYGTRSQHILPDGTRVVLNAGSSLTYPERFKRTDRLVNLEGEAFFEVVQRTKHPFIVKAGNIEVEVIGTVFNLQAYPNDATIETTLLSGKVKVNAIIGNTRQTVILAPNHKAVYNKKNQRMVMDETNADYVALWRNGILKIDNESLDIVTKKFNRWFNANISISDDLVKKHRLTMTIENETLEETLVLIKKATGLEYLHSNGAIIIYENK